MTVPPARCRAPRRNHSGSTPRDAWAGFEEGRGKVENKTLPSLCEDLKEEVEAWVDISTNINVSGHPKPGARKEADRSKCRNSWPRPWAKKLLRTRIGSPTRM